MRVGVAEQAPVVVAVGVLPGRENVFVAATQGPFAELPEHELGTWAEFAPQVDGTTALRALRAVKKAAYDHVRSDADKGLPLDLEYCSAKAPFCGVYCCALAK